MAKVACPVDHDQLTVGDLVDDDATAGVVPGIVAADDDEDGTRTRVNPSSTSPSGCSAVPRAVWGMPCRSA